jgi:hypothetical protein
VRKSLAAVTRNFTANSLPAVAFFNVKHWLSLEEFVVRFTENSAEIMCNKCEQKLIVGSFWES